MGVLKATHEGVLSLGKIQLECHVLEDGRRIFSSRGLLSAFNLKTDQKDQPRILRGFLEKIRFISLPHKELSNPLTSPIKFMRGAHQGRFFLPSRNLVKICATMTVTT